MKREHIIHSIAIFIVWSFMLMPGVIAQIPNGGFENWVDDNGIEAPAEWETNQSSEYIRIVKDSFAVEGDYALRLIPSANSAWLDCVSRASVFVEMDSAIGENKVLVFYARTILDSLNISGEVYLKVSAYFYVDNEVVESSSWLSLEAIDDYEKIEIPIENGLANAFFIEILGGAFNGAADGCGNKSISWIDGMAIETLEPTSIYDSSALDQSITIFPNPTNGWININANDDLIAHFTILDIQGEVIKSRRHDTAIYIEQSGIYFILFHQRDGKVSLSKPIIVN